MIGFMVYCGGLVLGIVGASWVCELIENGRKDSWRHRVSADDIKELGKVFNK